MPTQYLTLDEFIFEQLKILEDFEDHWRSKNLENKETYPLELLSGDWIEQLLTYSNNES
jgi:hypothetical protein